MLKKKQQQHGPRWLSAPTQAKYMYMAINFKHLLLQNSLAYKSQISCEEGNRFYIKGHGH